MPRKKLRSKDKITLKMTRKGLVELNKTTGEQRHVGSQERKTEDYVLGRDIPARMEEKTARTASKKRKQQLPPPDFGYDDIRNDTSIPANVEFRRDGSMVDPTADLDMDDLESVQLTDAMRQSVDKPARRSRRVKKAQSRKKKQVQQAQARQNPATPQQPTPRPKPIDRPTIPDTEVPLKSENPQEHRVFSETPEKIDTPVDAPIQTGKKRKSSDNFRLDKARPEKCMSADSLDGGEKSDAGKLNFSPQARPERDVSPDISRKKAKAKAMASQRLQFDNAEVQAPEQEKPPDISAEVREERLQYREGIPDPGAEMIKPNEDMQKRRKLRQSQITAYQQKSAKEAALQEKAASSSSTPTSVSAPAAPTLTQNAEPSKKLFFEEDKPSKTENHAEKSKNPQKSAAYQQKFAEFSAETENTRKTADSKSSQGNASESSQPKNQKFQFAADEKPPDHFGEKLTDSRRGASDRVDNSRANRLYEKSKRDTERLEGKLGEARDSLPQKKKLSRERIFDEQSGKVKREIHLENVAKTQAEHLKGPLPTRPIKAAGNAVSAHAHRKMYQVEHENVGTKAAHRTEMAAEGLARSALRFTKTHPYKKVSKLQAATEKSQVKQAYRKALRDNPKLQSNPLSRIWQKQRIKMQYAKAARQAKRTGENIAATNTLTKKARKALASIFRKHPALIVSTVLLLLMLFIIMTSMTSCSNIISGGFSAILGSSYTAPDTDIDDAESLYREWETDLEIRIDNIENEFPGYDEYKYEIDDITHNPYELLAYLTAKYQNFKLSDIRADLRQIFDAQYVLELVPTTEIRYRMETFTDPNTGQTYTQEMPYDWRILSIKLTAHSFTDVVNARMDSDQRKHFDTLMDTKGNRQYALSPFDFDWHPYISSYYGWRIHPVTGFKDNHKGVDIAVASGTKILATHDAQVTDTAYDSQYGYYVTLDNGNGLITKYAHCSEILVSKGQSVKKGDPIARVGSSGNALEPYLHFEVMKDGNYLNPLFFSETIKVDSNNPVFSDYPGEPMTDARYAALMEEAVKHLGKPYVFGSSGPKTFDCSSFVSYSLRHSGVWQIATTAQGLYNGCTPVSKANAKPGDLIFFQGTYSTSRTVTHVGIYIGNDKMLHCGKPVQYTSIDTNYWRKHFYAFGRIPE